MTPKELGVVAQALLKTTERLSAELAVPVEVAPVWTEFEWRIAIASAAMHGLSSLLRSRLLWTGPEIWEHFLADQQRQSISRHQKIERLLEAIRSSARKENLPLTMLKGAALYADRVYCAAERPMGDIDLLVGEGQGAAVDRVLRSCGYRSTFRTRRHVVFAPDDGEVVETMRLGEHIDSPIKIEVHTKVSERLPVSETDITSLLTEAGQPGLSGYRSQAALMLHLLLHMAGNMRARALRMIQVHDVALLSRRFGPKDWEELAAMRPNARGLWWAYAPLALVGRYYPGRIPKRLPDQFGLECPRLLRSRARRQQITEVSWSNIRIEAFPGIEWSKSIPEAFLFMRSRVWPSRIARLELKDAAAQIPGVESVPWYGRSHLSRIGRWVFSRPPRVQTMLSVRAALKLEI